MGQTEQEAFWYLNLTPQQQTALGEFTVLLKEQGSAAPGHDDIYTLLRFLKARQWDVTKASAMYADMIKWRAENGIDAVLGTFVEYPEYHDVQDVYPHFYHKTDKFGRPLYIELIGRTEPLKLMELSPMDRFMQYHIFRWERLEQQLLPASSAAAGRPIITTCVIVDLAQLSLKNFSLTAQNLLKTVAKVDQDYFPEHLGQMFIINTPLIFKAIWAVVYTMLEERTRNKILVLGSDYKAKLLEIIPEENLPQFLGGTSVCADFKKSIGAWAEEEGGACMSPSNSARWAAALQVTGTPGNSKPGTPHANA